MIGIRTVLLAASAPWFVGAFLQAQDPQVINKTYRMGSDVFWGSGGHESSDAPGDKVSEEKPRSPIPVQSAQQILAEILGIEFPEGTWVHYDPRSRRMEIQHYPGVVAAIQSFFETMSAGEKSMNIRVEIYQMPAMTALRLQQFCGSLDDHDAARQNVTRMIERKEATLVTTSSIIVRSGQRAKAQQVNELIYPTAIEWDDDGEKAIPVANETRNVGTIFEVDAVLGADDFTIDLNISLKHHSAPPTMRPIAVTSPKTGRKVLVEFPEFHTSQIITQLTLRDGSVKLIGAWLPTGKPEFEKAKVMQVAFLMSDVVTKESIAPETGGDTDRAFR